jgi:hypothetical protein
MRLFCAGLLVISAVAGVERVSRADEPLPAPTPVNPAPAPADQAAVSSPANGSRPLKYAYFDREACEECNEACCGTFWSDCRFLFGTCQEFFGDPKLRIPPYLIHYPPPPCVPQPPK